MKSRLFTPQFLEGLLRAADTSEVTAALAHTHYRVDLERGMVRYPGLLGIEEGLRYHVLSSFRKVKELAESEPQAYQLLKVLFSRWDIHNLKTILRGKHAAASDREIQEQLIPIGELDEAHLTELVRQINIKGCLDLLAMWGLPYARPLTEGYPHYLKTRRLTELELRLDKFYYQYAQEQVKGWGMNADLVRELLRREVDVTNLVTLIRLMTEDVPREKIPEYFLPGGKILTVEQLVALAELEEVEEIVEALKKTPYAGPLREGLKQYLKTGSLAVVERRMEEFNIQQIVRLFRADPLSAALMVAYIWAKFNEMVNLRIILRGKAVGMPEEAIREALVIV